MNNPEPSSLTIDEDENTQSTPFFAISEGKLITLYILSFGFYGVYWFYKNWQLLQPSMDKKILPFWRGIFSIFFAHSLFTRIDHCAKDFDNENRYNPLAMSFVFIASIVIGHLLDRLPFDSIGVNLMTPNNILILSLILFVISTYPLVKVQATVNRLNNDMLGYLNYKYSFWNYVLILGGTALWFLILLEILAQSTELLINQK